MCDPATLTVVATAVAVAGTVAHTASAMSAATYQARLADRNAVLQNDAAKDALERGRIADREYQQQQSQFQGEQRAALAANGIDPGFGSAAAVRGDTAVIGAQDAQTLRENSIREVKGFEIGAANYRAQAQASRQARTGALIEGVFGVANTVLGGATQYRKLQAGRAG